MNNFQEKANLIWNIADLLRGDYKPREYVDAILPMTVFRRLDQAVEDNRQAVWDDHKRYRGELKNLDGFLQRKYGRVYNTSPYNWHKLMEAPDDLAQNLVTYLNGFSPDVQDIVEKFDFRRQISRLQAARLIYPILDEFNKVDLHPDRVKNREMGLIFENLIRRFSEQYNETAGEHFTPREVIRLMVHLLFAEQQQRLADPSVILKIYDPACGTGGMLTEAKSHLENELREQAPQIWLFGQELNPQAYAVAKSDMLLKGEDPERIVYGNSFSEDGYSERDKYRFEIMMSNPPFGVSWKKVQWVIKREHETMGEYGRFGAGLPRINDGALLFLQHMLHKMDDDQAGSRIAIIFNGSPLFTGDAGSGESEIRRWIIENDWLETIVALPDQLFYNTGINTYIWILTNRKDGRRKGKIQLINAVDFYVKMRKSLGDKRQEISDEQIEEITAIFQAFSDGEYSRIYENRFFGYRKVRVERPLRLNFQTSPERIALLEEQSGFQNLAKSRRKDPDVKAREEAEGREQQERIRLMLTDMPDTLYKSRPTFVKGLRQVAKEQGVALKSPLLKAILAALSERDETAEICYKKDKQSEGIEPDTTLRDHENVPLSEDDYPDSSPDDSYLDERIPLTETVRAYFEREVLPYVPDAFIDLNFTDHKDGRVGRIGYEINFNRYFYKYQPPRDLDVIQTEIKTLETEIMQLLAAVTT
ncbi:MAG: SAM-dependent DNA methyltransferase [Chloroflexi bacterium]|nr:SAM-dependent DNA methyltransferase [Chloroflexota bacterium]